MWFSHVENNAYERNGAEPCLLLMRMAIYGRPTSSFIGVVTKRWCDLQLANAEIFSIKTKVMQKSIRWRANKPLLCLITQALLFLTLCHGQSFHAATTAAASVWCICILYMSVFCRGFCFHQIKRYTCAALCEVEKEIDDVCFQTINDPIELGLSGGGGPWSHWAQLGFRGWGQTCEVEALSNTAIHVHIQGKTHRIYKLRNRNQNT